MAKVAALGRQQAFGQVAGVRLIGQQRLEPALRQQIEPLVVPKRVVDIKADRRQVSGEFWRHLHALVLPPLSVQINPHYRGLFREGHIVYIEL